MKKFISILLSLAIALGLPLAVAAFTGWNPSTSLR